MKRKAICIIKEHKDLSEKTKEINESRERMLQAISFAEKQARNAAKRHHDEVRPLWADLEKLLKDSNMLPEDYDPTNDSLFFGDDGVLFMEKKGELADDKTQLLKELLDKHLGDFPL